MLPIKYQNKKKIKYLPVWDVSHIHLLPVLGITFSGQKIITKF